MAERGGEERPLGAKTDPGGLPAKGRDSTFWPSEVGSRSRKRRMSPFTIPFTIPIIDCDQNLVGTHDG